MTLDLVILGFALLFALWGFFSGAARQIAIVLAFALAWLAAGPLGQFYGPVFAKGLSTSAVIGTVLASVGGFVVVLVFVQIFATLILRRIFAGRDPQSRTADRVLGFLLGGTKVLAVVYVALCATSFLEKNVTIWGKKIAFVPKDSRLMTFVREYNLLESQQFSGAHHLLTVARLTKDTKRQQRLKDNADWAALLKDSRFTKALNTEAMAEALETGSIRGLLFSNEVVELIQDPQASRRLERLADRAE